jgi:hypothetical protein
MSHIPILIIHAIPIFANYMQEKLGAIYLLATSRDYSSNDYIIYANILYNNI